MPVYLNIFNQVLDRGIVPELRSQRIIVPIYKKVPNNYRLRNYTKFMLRENLLIHRKLKKDQVF